MKGSTKQAAKDIAKKKNLVMLCATLYQSEKEKMKRNGCSSVPDGTLIKIIAEETEKAGLSTNSIPLDTVRSRVKRGNLAALNANQLSPISDIEPFICQFCICLGKMGSPLTKKPSLS